MVEDVGLALNIPDRSSHVSLAMNQLDRSSAEEMLYDGLRCRQGWVLAS